jgi:flagellar protein FliJ
MKRRTGKIGRVVSLAAAEERRFGEQTGRSQRGLNDQSERLGELNAFRHNYAKKNPAVSGVSAAHWKDYQNFLQRLDNAVVSQQQIIRDCEQNLEVHRKRWLVKRQKLESLERVLEKCRNQDAVYEARLEQRRLDDLPCNSDSVLKPRHR